MFSTYAGNVNGIENANIDINDQLALVNIILNNPSCINGSPRTVSNSFITMIHQSSLSRGEGEILEIILSTETAVRAVHFEFSFPDSDILEVYLSNEFSDFSIDWASRSDTLAIVIYDAEGQAIPAGTHHIAYIEFEDQLERSANQNIDYISGQYADNARNLFPIVLSGQDQQDNFLPKRFALYPPYPNPFNSVTTIAYDLPNDGAVNLSIYNLRGALIEELETGFKNAGSYKISWEAGNLASGLYFVKFTSSDFSATRKLLFLK